MRILSWNVQFTYPKDSGTPYLDDWDCGRDFYPQRLRTPRCWRLASSHWRQESMGLFYRENGVILPPVQEDS